MYGSSRITAHGLLQVLLVFRFQKRNHQSVQGRSIWTERSQAHRSIASIIFGSVRKPVLFEHQRILFSICFLFDRFNGLIESEKRMWQKTNMRTQDAFLHNNNVEMAISAADIDEFQNYCTQSMKILRAGRDSFIF